VQRNDWLTGDPHSSVPPRKTKSVAPSATSQQS
jgi:hypothetical protein